MVLSFLIAFVVAASLATILILIASHKKKANDEKLSDKIQKKGKAAILKENERKLLKDPHNVNSLEFVSDIYFSDKNWEKTWSSCKTLYELGGAHPEIDISKATLRMGIAAYHLEKYEDALNSLAITAKKDPNSFEANFYAGQTFYKLGVFDKATICLKKSKLLQPDNAHVTELLSKSLFKCQKYRDALPFLKQVADQAPENKENLYFLAVAMTESNMGDKALKLFTHLRPDPEYGAQACLEAGKIHERQRDYQNAVADYLIALKLPKMPEQTGTQIKYRLANAYIQLNDIQKSLVYLKQLQNEKPGYKDVESLISRYSELNQNKNLQTYMMSGTSDFTALCRKFIMAYHQDTSVIKVEDVNVQSECVEIICEVQNPKWEQKQIFRFYRTQNAIGDLNVREFHSRIRDAKCDTGICVTVGLFSDSAHKFIEGRPVDLIEKEELVKILKKVSMLN